MKQTDNNLKPPSHPPRKEKGGLRARFWLWFCRAVVWAFYRRHEVEGRERIPKHGPLVICANHPSALVDAVILQWVSPRLVHPLARSGLFRNPLVRPLLSMIRAVPVHRQQDVGSDTSRNVDMFERCYEMLESGGALLIFPEGVTHSQPQLQKLKTGAARLALGYLARTGEKPVVLPVGLNFSEAGRFRSSVLVRVGDPLSITIHPTESEEDATRRITEEIREGLVAVTINLETWDEMDILRRLERFFALRRGRYRHRDLKQRFRSLQKLRDTWKRLEQQAPTLLNGAVRHLDAFERMCAKAGVKDYHLTINYTPRLVAQFLMRSLATLALLFPLAIWGALNSYIPFMLSRHLALRLSHDRYHYDTAKISFALFLFPGFWGVQTALMYQWSGTAVAWGYALMLLPSAMVAQFMRRERRRLTENIKVFMLFLWRRELRVMLELQREQLEKELARLARLAKRKMS